MTPLLTSLTAFVSPPKSALHWPDQLPCEEKMLGMWVTSAPKGLFVPLHSQSLAWKLSPVCPTLHRLARCVPDLYLLLHRPSKTPTAVKPLV